MSKPTFQHHGWQLPERETLHTLATLVTIVRTIFSIVCALYALVAGNITWVYWALAIYWVGDVLDGWLARRFNQEMRIGAVLDVVTDRLCVAVIYVVFVMFHPEIAIGMGIYLFQFMALDSLLSLSFLFWPLLSLNYFFLVDKKLYNLNWSVPAKVFNSSLFILVTMLFVNPWLSALVALINLAIKCYSLHRLLYVVGIPAKH